MTHFTYIFEVVTNQREHDSVQNIIWHFGVVTSYKSMIQNITSGLLELTICDNTLNSNYDSKLLNLKNFWIIIQLKKKKKTSKTNVHASINIAVIK